MHDAVEQVAVGENAQPGMDGPTVDSGFEFDPQTEGGHQAHDHDDSLFHHLTANVQPLSASIGSPINGMVPHVIFFLTNNLAYDEDALQP